MYTDLAFRRARLGLLSRPLVAAITTVARAIDRGSARHLEPGPDVLFASVHVVAEVPR